MSVFRPGIRTVLGRWLGVRRTLDAAGHVALTFDDGPEPGVTDRVLDVLHARGARATFFVLGEQAVAHPHLVRRIVEEGHELASHGFRHRDHRRRPPWTTVRDLRRATRAIEAAGGVRPRRHRPPYGRVSLATLLAARLLRQEVVLWSVDGSDWLATGTAEDVARCCTARLTDRDIVLLHDSVLQGAARDQLRTPRALAQLLDHIDATHLQPGGLT